MCNMPLRKEKSDGAVTDKYRMSQYEQLYVSNYIPR